MSKLKVFFYLQIPRKNFWFLLLPCLIFFSALVEASKTKKNLGLLSAEKISLTFFSAQVPGLDPEKVGPEGVVFSETPLFFQASIKEAEKEILFEQAGKEYWVGDPRFEYQFWWFLEDDRGKKLASSHSPDKPPPFLEGKRRSVWNCKYRFNDPYSLAYPHKCRVVVRIRFRLQTKDEIIESPKDSAYSRKIDQIIDWKSPNVSFPFSQKSGFKTFHFETLGTYQPNKATTCGITRLNNGSLVSRGLNPDIFQAENFQESFGTDHEGFVIIKWDNLWDNFRFPFNGGTEPFFKSFGLVLFADWNLVESSPLAGVAETRIGKKVVPPQNSLCDWNVSLFEHKGATAGYIDLSSAFDQSNRVVCRETKHQPLGPGYILLKMPYDKVGRLTYGFFLEDHFQNKSVIILPTKRFIDVSDDLAPAIMIAIKNSNESFYWNGVSGGKDWRARKEQECKLALNGEPWNMSQDQSLGGEKTGFETDEDLPINLYVSAYDNCRLHHIVFSLLTANPSLKGTFGFRGQQSAKSSEGFTDSITYPQDLKNLVSDEAISDMLFETSLDSPIQMVFTEPSLKPSDYNLLVRAEDRAGNAVEYTIPITVRDTGFEIQTIREIQNRIK
ncbi:hypothetical protein HYY75_11060 [bacterium]|nr:hypothetical protein [bacterium]